MQLLFTKLAVLVVALFVTLPAVAFEYSSLLLRAQASVFPKIIMLDADIDKKVINNTVVLHIIYESDDIVAAKNTKRLIESTYGDNLGGYGFKVEVVDSRVGVMEVATAYLLLNVESDTASRSATQAVNNQRICFSYNYKDLDNTSLISLQMKEKVYIYLSKKRLSEYDIRFQSVFYNIVKVVE